MFRHTSAASKTAPAVHTQGIVGMIITQKKPMEELMAMVGDASIAIVRCDGCTTACHTGGEPEVAALHNAMEAAGKKVVGTTIAEYLLHEPRCQGQDEAPRRGKAGLRYVYVLRRRRAVRRKMPRVVRPTTPCTSRTMRLASEEACPLCGDCVLGQTGGSPVTPVCRPASTAPCGGQKNGSKVEPRNDCAWIKIYKRLGEIGRSTSSATPARTRATRSSAIRERSA